MARLRSKTGIAQFQRATPDTPEAAVRRPAHTTSEEAPRRRDLRAGLRVRLRVKNRPKDYVLGNRIEPPPIPESITGANDVLLCVC